PAGRRRGATGARNDQPHPADARGGARRRARRAGGRDDGVAGATARDAGVQPRDDRAAWRSRGGDIARACRPFGAARRRRRASSASVDSFGVVTTDELRAADRAVLWHPFTQMQGWQDEDAPIIERALGCTLWDTEGNAYIDGTSSLWCNIHGHCHPHIDAAIRDQLEQVAHSTMLGLSH